MQKVYRAVLVVCCAVLFGCATVGRDFVQPDASELVLGQTTKSEVIAKYGPPREDRTVSAQLKSPGEKPGEVKPDAPSGLYTRVRYSFVNPMGEADGGVSPQRAANFWFWNDKLVGYEYLSSFKADATNFREEAISRIERNKTT